MPDEKMCGQMKEIKFVALFAMPLSPLTISEISSVKAVTKIVNEQ